MATTLTALRQRSIDKIIALDMSKPGYRAKQPGRILHRIKEVVQARYPTMPEDDILAMIQDYLERHPATPERPA